MAVATGLLPSAMSAKSWASSTSAPNHTHRGQTAKPNASFRLHFGNGLMPSLSNLGLARTRAADLATSIRLAPPPWWYRRTNADQPAPFEQGQPLEAPP